MDIKEIISLSKAAMKAEKNAPVAYSCVVDGKAESFSSAELNKALRAEFNKLTGYVEGVGCNYREFKRNENTIYQIIEETITEVLPPRVEEQYRQFADVRVVPQGDKAKFTLKVTERSKRRFKACVSQRAGLAGRWETYILDGASMEVKTGAVAAAARIGFEEFLDGRWEFSEFTTLMLESLDEFILAEVISALGAMVADIPVANRASVDGFDEDTMDELLSIVDTYGRATIYCTQEFANKMVPSDARFSNEMKNEIWRNGWLGDYKGHQVVIMQQSLVFDSEEVNTQKVVNPALAYLIPTGSEKPIKIVFEGQTQVRNIENQMDDWSSEIQTYTKVGVANIAALDGVTWIGCYENTALSFDTRSASSDIDVDNIKIINR